MNHDDHVRLIRNGVSPGGKQVWGDFGSGWGAFTLALRDVAGPAVEIWSVDRSESSLRAQRAEFDRRFPGTNLHLLVADFTQPLELPPLDGIVAANSIHYVRDQAGLLRDWRRYLAQGGRLVIVEYEMERPNSWVPYPVSFRALGSLAAQAGFAAPRLLEAHPSRRSPQMYAAELQLVATV
jgi:ubiquinone/menaquinone biosynthesis C-methylase UbiE